MIEFLPDSAGNFVAVRATGKLHHQDYKDVLIPRLEEAFARHGKLRLLVELDQGFEGWDLGAAWDDAAFGLGHRADFEKIAVVGGPRWVDWSVKALRFLMKGEMRTFPPEAGGEARAWLWG